MALTSLVTRPQMPRLQEDPPQTPRVDGCSWPLLAFSRSVPQPSSSGAALQMGMEQTGLGAGQARRGPHPGGRGQGPAQRSLVPVVLSSQGQVRPWSQVLGIPSTGGGGGWGRLREAGLCLSGGHACLHQAPIPGQQPRHPRSPEGWAVTAPSL